MKHQPIGLDDIVVQVKGNLESNMDGEKVMMSVHSGKYYNLGQIGGVIWDKIESPVSVRQLIAFLTTEYDIDREACGQQVIGFLQSMLQEQLIHTGDDAAAHTCQERA